MAGTETQFATQVDLRQQERNRERVPEAFGRLRPGEAMLLVSDHDPTALRHLFDAEQRGRFEWEYLERGPDTWRIRLGRR